MKTKIIFLFGCLIAATALYAQAHDAEVRSVAFSPDGRYILSGSMGYENNLILWDAATKNRIRVFSGHDNHVRAVAFSQDGRQILSGGNGFGDNLILWDTATGNKIRTFAGHNDYITSVAISRDGRQALSGSEDNTVKLWDIASGREIRTFQGHTDYVRSVAFSPDGRQFVSGSDDSTIIIWDIATGNKIRTFTDNIYFVRSVAFSPDGTQILTAEERCKLWDAATGRKIRDLPNQDFPYSAVFSPDGRHILSASADGILTLYETATGNEIRTFTGHTDVVYSLAFSPDGRQAVSGSGDKTVRVWDISSVTGSSPQQPTAADTKNPGIASNNIFQYIPVVHELAIETDADDQGGNSTGRVNIGKRIIDGNERTTINLSISLNGRIQYPWACLAIKTGSIIERAKVSSGIRFKVIGDGRPWYLELCTTEAADYAFYRYKFDTNKDAITIIDVPYSILQQPEWGNSTFFNRSSIYGIQFSINSDDGLGSSSIEIFDIELY
jgi:uncharacterized protein with WD repeat